MAHFDLPLRSNRKDLARAAHLRNFAMVGRPFNSRSTLPASYDDTYLPVSRRMPDRSLNNPYYPSPLTPYQADPSLESHFSAQLAYRPASYPRRTNTETYTPSTRLSFDKAARALHHALDRAALHVQHLETTFDKEIRYIPYADERTRAHLWMLKVEYRGWNVDVDAPPEANEQVDFFPKHAGRLLDAIEDMRDAEHPSSSQYGWGGEQRGGGGYDIVAMEDVRLALKKLGVSFGAIGELLEGVKVDKQRCLVLHKELSSAIEILNGIKQTWELPRNGKGGYRESAGAAGGGKAPLPAFIEVWDEFGQT